MAGRKRNRTAKAKLNQEVLSTQLQLARLDLAQKAEMHQIQRSLAEAELRQRKNPFLNFQMWVGLGGVAAGLGTLCVLVWTSVRQDKVDTIRHEQLRLNQTKLERENEGLRSQYEALQGELTQAKRQVEEARIQREAVSTALAKERVTYSRIQGDLNRLLKEHDAKQADLKGLESRIQALRDLTSKPLQKSAESGVQERRQLPGFDGGFEVNPDSGGFSGGSFGGFDAGAFSGGSYGGSDAGGFSDGSLGGSSSSFSGGAPEESAKGKR